MKNSNYSFMKVLIIALVFIKTSLPSAFIQNPVDSAQIILPQEYFREEQLFANTVLTRYHFKKFVLNDSLSSLIFDRYLMALDPSKLYFVDSDIKKFEKFRFKIDDHLLDGDLDKAYEIFNIYRNRVFERINYAIDILQNEFDFSIDEYLEIKRDSSNWALNENELNEIWRKRVKNDALNLKLAGKEWNSISETLKKRYESIRKAVAQTKSEDVFQLYMNSYTETIDPHSNYLLPITSDNFKIDMSRSLEGIGAQLQSEDDYTKVVEVIPGGPAFKSNLLHRDDKIIGVAQGEDGEMVDIVGWRVNDVVKLIRGPKGTIVRLLILQAADGPNAIPKEIKLVRDKVKLEDQSAKKQILEFKNGIHPYRIGVISIPAFYLDYEAAQRGERDYKSTTNDVRKLIQQLKNENINGIIIDLRNNGGGSLSEAVELTGLFIKDGPIVQVKHAFGNIDVQDDPDPSIVYDGPLAVLVNRFSASASEIFSAAIQDYGRGIILGEQTYGKGTVQNLIDLNRMMGSNANRFGQVKITIAKYYRITGGSTQHLGVIPDIAFPSVIDANEFGESSEPSALPWDQIQSTAYNTYANIAEFIPLLKSKHELRIKNDPLFQSYLEDVNESRQKRQRSLISLNETIRRKEKEEEDLKKERQKNKDLESLSVRLVGKEELSEKDSTSKDALLNESAFILSDYIDLITG